MVMGCGWWTRRGVGAVLLALAGVGVGIGTPIGLVTGFAASVLVASTALAAHRNEGVKAAPQVIIRGNRVLNTEVYRFVLDLPKGAKANAKTASLVREQIQEFLQETGFALAKVRVQIRRKRIVVDVDEGKLDKVIVLGTSGWTALRLKLNFDLPYDVFSRPALLRWIGQMQARYRIEKLTYRLVRVGEVEHEDPQIDPLSVVFGTPMEAPGDYELHLTLSGTRRRQGFWPQLKIGTANGLEFGVNYAITDLLAEGDEVRTLARLGLNFVTRIDDGKRYVAMSLARLLAYWTAPPLIGSLRFRTDLEAQIISRQRPDLDLESYFGTTLAAKVGFQYEILPRSFIQLGGGYEQLFVHNLEERAEVPPSPSVVTRSRARPFVEPGWELVMDPDNPRRDRLHRIEGSARWWWDQDGEQRSRVWTRYENTVPLGWHDIYYRLQGAWLSRDILFVDEEPVGGRYLRGLYGGRFHVQRVLGTRGEFRFSIVRDIHKISLFNDTAVYEELGRSERSNVIRVATGFGLGYHALILDALQLNVYYGVGIASDNQFDHGLSLNLKQAFGF